MKTNVSKKTPDAQNVRYRQAIENLNAVNRPIAIKYDTSSNTGRTILSDVPVAGCGTIKLTLPPRKHVLEAYRYLKVNRYCRI